MSMYFDHMQLPTPPRLTPTSLPPPNLGTTREKWVSSPLWNHESLISLSQILHP